MSDVHSDWKDYGRSNYTVCARINDVSEGDNTAARQMENSFEVKIEMERETTIKLKGQHRVHISV